MTATADPSERSGSMAPRSFVPPVRGRLSEVPHIAGLVLGVFAVLLFLWSLSPTLRFLIHVPREYVDNYYFDAPDTSLSWALVVGLLAAALASRKRIAWWLLTIYLVLLAITNVVEGITEKNVNSWIALAVHVVATGLLIAARKEFYTRVRRGAVWKALGVLVLGAAVGTVIGWALVALFPGSLPESQTFLWAFNRVTALATVDNEQFDGRPNGIVNTALGLFGALALLGAVITLFRSQRSSNALTGRDESALRGLLDKWGADDSLGYFATRRDKGVIFATSGKAAVTYRVEVGVCLASGDPIGNPEAWPHAISEWLDLAEKYGWTPAVMGASEIGATAYKRAGLSVLELGDEAILKTKDFNLNGREMRPVRQAVNRARKAGVVVTVRRHREISSEEMSEIIACADAWRDTETERGFSMALGRLGDPLDGDCLLVQAVQGEKIIGVLSLVPWGRTGASLDLMRRDPTSPNGVIELMVTELATGADHFGVSKISLNFAVFRAAFEEGSRIGAGPVLRIWRSVLVFFSRWWQLEALYRSNVKYLPDWEPRYLCFAENRVLPKVGVASAIAEGFLTLPTFRRASKHTGSHVAVPAALADADDIHSDGSGPETSVDETVPGRKRPDQVRVRMAKLDRLESDGIEGYPVAYPPTHTVGEAVASPQGTTVRIAGRILRIRDYGGVSFAVIRDWSADIQVLFDRERVGDRIEEFDADFDLGDLIEVSGTIGYSRRGELSLLATEWRMNAKCLHPLPDKYRGLTDPEARVRQRYVDLAINRDARA